MNINLFDFYQKPPHEVGTYVHFTDEKTKARNVTHPRLYS